MMLIIFYSFTSKHFLSLNESGKHEEEEEETSRQWMRFFFN